MPELDGQRALIFIGDDYEDLELLYPLLRLREAGAEAVLAGLDAGRTYHGKHGYPQASDAAVGELDPSGFDLLVVPGGWMPDKLRRDPAVLSITRSMAQAGKPIASICHGPWIEISAGIVGGVRYTSTPGIKDDLKNAGALWQDAEVVVDKPHKRVSARRPGDLPAFCRALIQMASGAL
ncbi:MAG: type 1 glutamine amidotransferase domain-containing protein [Planctomycetota bacterium]